MYVTLFILFLTTKQIKPQICGLSASLLFANDDRDVYDVWLSHWLRVLNGLIGAPY